jgi:hypothetical protein
LNPNLRQVDLTQDPELIALVRDWLHLRFSREEARRAMTTARPSTPAPPPAPRTAQDEELVRLFREFRELQEAWGDLPPSNAAPSAAPPGSGEKKRRLARARPLKPLNPKLAQVDLTQDQELVELVKESLRLRLAKEAARRAQTNATPNVAPTPRTALDERLEARGELDLTGIKPFDSQEQADEAFLLRRPLTPAERAASKVLLEDLLQRPERLSSPATPKLPRSTAAPSAAPPPASAVSPPATTKTPKPEKDR